MALLNFLKNKEEADKAKEKKVAAALDASDTAKSEKKAKVKKATTEPKSNSGKAGSFSYTLVREPLISEKSNALSAQNKYVFKVMGGANKPEIKKSIEGIYGVNVISVNVMNTQGKKRRVGKIEGFRKGFSKAIVTIKEGQKIEIF